MSEISNVNDAAESASAQDLRDLGRMLVAYLRPAVAEGVPGFAIHGADGAVIGFATDRDAALGAILQHGMEPVSLH